MLCRHCSLADALPPLSPRPPHFGRSFAAKCVMAHSSRMLCRFRSSLADALPLCYGSSGYLAVVVSSLADALPLFSHRLLLRMLCRRGRLVFTFAAYLHCGLPMCYYLHVIGSVVSGAVVDCTHPPSCIIAVRLCLWVCAIHLRITCKSYVTLKLYFCLMKNVP
jgi:hypothetical protein